MGHCVVPEAEKILDRKFKVLDKGFIRLVDYMGGDERIVAAARVSYGKGTKTFRQDRGLIHYLLRHEHTSPFEQVVFTFHVKLPIFVARQWIRHRTARVNEISGRYSVMAEEFYVPAARDIALQSEDNKQGRSTEAVPPALQQKVLKLLTQDQRQVYASYQAMLKDNVARELARINLPLSTYTEWYWQIDLNNLFHFLKLRLDAHAQMEIRVYAEAMERIGRTVCPIAFEAFDQYVVGSATLSRAELDVVRKLLRGQSAACDDRTRRLLKEKLGFDPLPADAAAPTTH